MQKNTLICFIDALVRNALDALEDEVYQKRVWFGEGDSDEVSSYTDVVVFFLDNCEFIFRIPDCESMLGEDNYILLRRLYELISSHLRLIEDRLGPENEPQEEELLNDPAWHDIQSLSRDVRIRLFKFLKKEGHKYE